VNEDFSDSLMRDVPLHSLHLVVGESLDRGMLIGITPPRQQVIASRARRSRDVPCSLSVVRR
jgi:hypothetical protein